MMPGDAYLALLVIIVSMLAVLCIHVAFHKPRRMRATDSVGASRPPPPMPGVVDREQRAARDRKSQLERIMLADRSISYAVACNVWGGEPDRLHDDKTRAAFMAVWVLARREMAETILKEIENG